MGTEVLYVLRRLRVSNSAYIQVPDDFTNQSMSRPPVRWICSRVSQVSKSLPSSHPPSPVKPRRCRWDTKGAEQPRQVESPPFNLRSLQCIQSNPFSGQPPVPKGSTSPVGDADSGSLMVQSN
ncbi:hypothetical protein POX_a00806 [Penicillium oxalicum]|uniref:Uncharacterized protein n=1 Tax=Penicillium oxalicum (strain 114-2 / CGMCC 5302) TaxID=933388 RepID=S7ZZE9_PENO1|nr:hypothetical protein POX_a00806 [Penicillium oxalicum]EPS34221.1 hypothetical protein PDE_09185 [Penicillium oxalicum 114-2]KAI2794216.1 hypothetical protein POX_a00806 [Penicillium oxalicum]